jgi:hypothetical protein
VLVHAQPTNHPSTKFNFQLDGSEKLTKPSFEQILAQTAVLPRSAGGLHTTNPGFGNPLFGTPGASTPQSALGGFRSNPMWSPEESQYQSFQAQPPAPIREQPIAPAQSLEAEEARDQQLFAT